MASTDDGPPSQGRKILVQSSSTGAETSSQPTQTPDTPTPAWSRSLAICDLTRKDSDRISLRSHDSLPVIGTLPLGSLRVHKAMDSTRPPPPEEGVPQTEASDMPPLEDDVVGVPAPRSSNEGGQGSGDAFLILDLPKQSTVGCDAKAIGTGASEFKGIRGIPPGPHFVWTSEPNAMSRSGYWFVSTAEGRVRIKQWDRFNEVLVQPASRFEMRDLSENIASLYPQLLPHDYGGAPAAPRTASAAQPADVVVGVGDEDGARMWRRLTSSIDEELLSRVTGRQGVSEWLVDTSDSAEGESGFPQTTQTYRTVAGTSSELDFLFPEGDVDLGAIAFAAAAGGDQGSGPDQPGAAAPTSRDDTPETPDTTMSILRLLDHPGAGVRESDLVGELQFTFLTGLHLSNLSCIDQWWHLVLRVILRAHSLTLLRPGLARALIQTLHAQLAYNERYVAGGDDDNNNDDDDDDDDDDGQGQQQQLTRHEYAGGGAVAQGGTSILDVVPGNRRKLRAALTLFKRRMDGMLLGSPPGAHQRITDEQGAVGRAFVDMEAWFWRFGWDLRVDAVGRRGRAKREAGEGAGDDGDDGDEDELGFGGDDDDDDDDDDDYQPVIVDLDENGREVGLVSFS
ncbi:hypothetical protein VPNG_00673 [Cytospora leucostoma]|uniref:Uncharacterized protein n=1 Tax=Cytospora leucostoma TaxID=1230097 RepID=A0A423XM34_9PEZI|nr:hypothetical protein VPNG_00673 [Cytospora leucostoma]